MEIELVVKIILWLLNFESVVKYSFTCFFHFKIGEICFSYLKTNNKQIKNKTIGNPQRWFVNKEYIVEHIKVVAKTKSMVKCPFTFCPQKVSPCPFIK